MESKQITLLSIPEFAELLNVKKATIRRWLLERKIASVRVGGRLVRIPREEATRILEAGYVPARPSR